MKKDEKAILSRRRFLIDSALLSTGLAIGAACEGNAPEPKDTESGDTDAHETPEMCLQPPLDDTYEIPEPCLDQPPEDIYETPEMCLQPPPDDTYEIPQPCLDPPPDDIEETPNICLSPYPDE